MLQSQHGDKALSTVREETCTPEAMLGTLNSSVIASSRRTIVLLGMQPVLIYGNINFDSLRSVMCSLLPDKYYSDPYILL